MVFFAGREYLLLFLSDSFCLGVLVVPALFNHEDTKARSNTKIIFA